MTKLTHLMTYVLVVGLSCLAIEVVVAVSLDDRDVPVSSLVQAVSKSDNG